MRAVYELIGIGARRSRLSAAATRGLTRFIGRGVELEQLRQALGRSAAGHGQVVALVGEPGVGKSRLVWEVTHSHRVHGWLVLQAGSVSYGRATAYLPVVDLLKGYLKIQDQDDPRAVREKVTGKLLTLDEALKPTVSAFLALLDVPVDDAAWSALDPPQRRQRTLEAVKRLLLRESQVQPLLVVFEDLHWVDSETQAFLDSLVESLPTARMLLLVNYRPEYAHRWGSKTYYTQLRLDPLPPESAEALLDALVGTDPALRPLKHLLIERTEGNPFFLEESVRTLVETKGLAGERGGYRLAQALPSIRVPATVQAVLAARIDRLAPEEKRLLQAAAIIGKDVPFVVLQVIAEVSEDVLRDSLATLQDSEFLHETRLFPDLEYTFKHALTHEVAYGSLLQDRRRALHARIVQAIEALYAGRLAEHVERLAHHALRGELWDEAPGYLRQAGRRALGRSAYREAAGWLEQALEALGHVHESRATRELAIDLRLDLRNALWPAGDQAPILARLREAEALAEAVGDQRRLVQVRQMLANHLRVGGESRLAIEVGERAWALAARLGDDPLSWNVRADMAAAHVSLGEFRRAVELLGPVVNAVQDHPQGAQAVVGATFEPVFARFWLAAALGALGEFREACLRGQEAVMLARADQPSRIAIAQFALGLARLNQGDLVPAITSLDRAVAVCREWDIVDWLGGAATALGLTLVLEGRVSEGRAIAHEGMSRLARVRGPSSSHLVMTAEAELEARDPDAALPLAEHALELARRRGEQGNVARALRLLGAIASEREAAARRPAGSRQDGAILFSQALALANELGMRPLVAHCHLGLGKLYRRTGDRTKAEEHLGTATTMYREMDMRFYLAQAEAALGEKP